MLIKQFNIFFLLLLCICLHRKQTTQLSCGKMCHYWLQIRYFVLYHCKALVPVYENDAATDVLFSIFYHLFS